MSCREVDHDLVLRFAALTAARTDILLHIAPDNGGTVHGWPPPAPPQPFAVFVATNSGFRTLALDFDASRGDTSRDALYTGEMLTECGIRYITTISGTTGGRHVLVPAEEPVAAATAHVIAVGVQSRCSSLDIGPLTNNVPAIRPPLAPNRRGGRSELVTGVDEALDIFTTRNGPLAVGDLVDLLGENLNVVSAHTTRLLAAAVLPTRRLPLSGRMHSLAVLGDLTRRYPSTSEARFAVAVALARRGHSEAEFLAYMEGPLGHHNGRQAGATYLRSEWMRAVEAAVVEAMRADSFPTLLFRARELAHARSWPGRIDKQARDHRALGCVLDVVEERGSMNAVGVSVRHLARRMSVSDATAWRALRSLKEQGLITLVSTGCAIFDPVTLSGGHAQPSGYVASRWRLSGSETY